MRILKSLGAISLGGLVLIVGFSNNDIISTPMAAIQQGTGKMTVLYDGKESDSINFGSEPWAPGDTRSITVEIRNEGEVDFISSMSSGEYPTGHSIIHEMNTTVTNEAGEVVFKGIYPEIKIAGLDVPVGESEKLKVSVQWMPPANINLSQKRSGAFSMSINSQQKI